MNILRHICEAKATSIADLAYEEISWEKNTTNTFLWRLIKKGAVKRREPGFLCSDVYGNDEVLSSEAVEMVKRLYDGSIGIFVQAFLNKKPISQSEKECSSRKKSGL